MKINVKMTKRCFTYVLLAYLLSVLIVWDSLEDQPLAEGQSKLLKKYLELVVQLHVTCMYLSHLF